MKDPRSMRVNNGLKITENRRVLILRNMSELQMEMACELEDFCKVCRKYHPVEEVTDNVCVDCAKVTDELRFSKMDDPNWCCECCLVRKDVKVEGHVCADCKR